MNGLKGRMQAVADFDGSYTYGCGTGINTIIANYWDSTHPEIWVMNADGENSVLGLSRSPQMRRKTFGGPGRLRCESVGSERD